MTEELRLRFERTLPEPPATVWWALTDPAEWATWWGPRGFTNVVDVDLRVGSRPADSVPRVGLEVVGAGRPRGAADGVVGLDTKEYRWRSRRSRRSA